MDHIAGSSRAANEAGSGEIQNTARVGRCFQVVAQPSVAGGAVGVGRAELQSSGASGAEQVERSQWSRASRVEPVERSQWSGASGAEPVERSQSSEASGAEPVDRSQWSEASRAKPVEQSY